MSRLPQTKATLTPILIRREGDEPFLLRRVTSFSLAARLVGGEGEVGESGKKEDRGVGEESLQEPSVRGGKDAGEEPRQEKGGDGSKN